MSESRISIGKSTYTYLNSLEQRLEDEKHVSINERIGKRTSGERTRINKERVIHDFPFKKVLIL